MTPATGRRRGLFHPALRAYQRIAFVVSVGLVVVTLARIPDLDWGDAAAHLALHLVVLVWFGAVTGTWRTVGAREAVRFWLFGFFPVTLVAYYLTEPLSDRWSDGNAFFGVWVPPVEELLKLVPVLIWTTWRRPAQRHGSLGDFWFLGFALGAGFSLHEDALYGRRIPSGFGDDRWSWVFPTFHDGLVFVTGHGAWTALGATGIGLLSIHRGRVLAWIVAVGLVGLAVVDHAAVNWRGDGSERLRGLMLDGRLAAFVLVATVALAVGHDWWTGRWTTARDHAFPRPARHEDLLVLAGRRPPVRGLGGYLARQRYRRLRNAAFVDLYRVRSRGRSAGDRTRIRRQLTAAANLAGCARPSTG